MKSKKEGENGNIICSYSKKELAFHMTGAVFFAEFLCSSLALWDGGHRNLDSAPPVL